MAQPQSKPLAEDAVRVHRPRRLDDPHLTRRQREDPLVIGWIRFQDWIAENWKLALIVVGLVVVGILAGVLWSRARAERAAQGDARLAEVTLTYWRGDYARALQLAGAVKQEFSGTPAAAEATRIEGDSHFWNGDFDKAVTSYQAYLRQNRTPSVVRDGVRQNLAQAHESNGQHAEAAKLYEDLSGAEAPREVKAERLFSAARAYQQSGDAAKAKTLFARVATEYPETAMGRDAEMALGEIEANAAR